MVGLSSSNKKRKLPARYPREQEIMVFGDMSELDHVLELLAELSGSLSAAANTITNDDWERMCASPLATLVNVLRRAYVEYEQFWHEDGWRPEDDSALVSDLASFGGMRERVKEFENASYYDPAQLACAQSLYMALTLIQCPGEKVWVDFCIGSLRQNLTRYYAASLEILMGRNAVFANGRPAGAVAKSTKHIQQLAKDNRRLSAKELYAKADKSIIGGMQQGTFNNHVKDARKKFPKEKASDK